MKLTTLSEAHSVAKRAKSPIGISDTAWNKINGVTLDYKWNDIYPTPYVTVAKMLHGDDGIAVKMSSDEWPLSIHTMEQNGPVYKDSCMEFFFTPNTRDKSYMNNVIKSMDNSNNLSNKFRNRFIYT